MTIKKHEDEVVRRNDAFGTSMPNTTKDCIPDTTRSSCPTHLRPRFNTSFHHFRYVVVMMGGLSVACVFLLRYNIAVAITNMVNQTALYMEEHPNRTIEDFLDEGYSLGGEFDWSNEIQQMIMSWYMIAYTLPQVAVTKVANKAGAKWSTSISLSICAISTLLTPVVAYWGWQWVIGLRLINALSISAVIPMLLYVIERWVPQEDFSLALTLAQLLEATSLAVNPLICGYLSAMSWTYAFHGPAIFVLVFSILWLLLITDRPEENCLVSQKELDLISGRATVKIGEGTLEDNHKQVDGNNGFEETHRTNELATHTGTILDVMRTSAFYGYLIVWVLYCSTVNVFQFILPTYLRQFLKIDVASNGTYCSIIFSGTLIAAAWPHPFLRLLQTKFNLSMTVSRRLLQAVICFVVGGTWIYVGLFHRDQIVILFLNRCFHASVEILVCGSIMSNYAGAGMSSLVFSMTNSVGNLSVVLASSLTGYVLDQAAQSVAGWSGIYFVMSATQLLMLLPFVTLISSEPVQFKDRGKKFHRDLHDVRSDQREVPHKEQTRVSVVEKSNGQMSSGLEGSV